MYLKTKHETIATNYHFVNKSNFRSHKRKGLDYIVTNKHEAIRFSYQIPKIKRVLNWRIFYKNHNFNKNIINFF